MLFLVFQLGEDRYALDASQVAEVLPLVDLKQLPHAPTGVVGLCDCRGVPVPVIDLTLVALGRAAERRLSTRLVIAHYPDSLGGTHLLGLVAEKATEIVRREPSDFVLSGVTSERASYLGPVATDERGIVQRIDVGALLSEAVRNALFMPPAEP